MLPWSNPEYIRNCRAQLRPGRMLLVILLSALFSVVVAYAMAKSSDGRTLWPRDYLSLVLNLQTLVLVGGGTVATGLSVFREKERNTFDFQRVTQLSSLELATGKLFGGPVLAYFATLCLVPAATYGVVAADLPLSRLAGGYALLLASALAFHALGLLYSMGATRSSTGIAGVVLALFAVGVASARDYDRWGLSLGPISPMAVQQFVLHGTWKVLPWSKPMRGYEGFFAQQWTDTFFGLSLPHVGVFVLLYGSLAIWCLLAVVRNLKKDPAVIELYSPVQSVALLLYLNLVVVGFYSPSEALPAYDYQPQTLFGAVQLFLACNLIPLYVLGLALLRNREQVRRRLHNRPSAGFDWLEAGWPAACTVAAAVLVGLLVVPRLEAIDLPHDLDPALALYQAMLLVVVIARDLCFFQWMNLRRTSRPLILATILLGSFYVSSALIVSFSEPWKGPNPYLESILMPVGVLRLTPAEWHPARMEWYLGFAVQVALTAVFAALHYRALADLRPSPANTERTVMPQSAV